MRNPSGLPTQPPIRRVARTLLSALPALQAVLVLLIFAIVLTAPTADAQHNKQVEAAFKAIDKNQERTARSEISKISDPMLRKALMWYVLRHIPGASDTDEINAFVDQNPEWPDQSQLKRRAEELLPTNWPAGSIIAYFHQRPPVSDIGRARLVAALIRDGRLEEGVPMARKLWREGNFPAAEEKRFYRAVRVHLTKGDHIARLENLLWDGRFGATRRMFPRVPEDIRLLGEARFLLRHRRGNVDKAIARVPENLKNHEGLVYERLHWRRRKGRVASASELLAKPIDSFARPDLWARERIILARRSLEDGLISTAYAMVRDHGVKPTNRVLYSGAEWYAGWVALQFLNEPAWAYDHFRNVYRNVSFPISRARGAYWSGRAAAALGKSNEAKTWYEIAAIYPETYYGHLAIHQLDKKAHLSLPDDAPRPADIVERVEGHELARVARLLVEVNARNRVRPFVLRLAALDDSNDWKQVVAAFSRSIGRPDLAILIAKRVRQSGDLMIDASHPTLAALGLPVDEDKAMVNPALVHAIIRQESGFFVQARSHAGARGLMQVMPATAQLVSKKHKLKYVPAKLQTDPVQNMKIGRTYLADLVEQFDGSYILALAAYNAGPNRAKRWIREFGDPRTAEVDPIDWVEMVPFNETRNYVQRVMENLQVYRTLLHGDEKALQIAADLRRSLPKGE